MSKTARQADRAATVVLMGDSITQRRHAIPTLDEIKDAQGPLIYAIKSEWRKPCRCGPDGCADSVACPRR